MNLLESLARVIPGISLAETVFYHQDGLRFFRHSDAITSEADIPQAHKPDLFRKMHKMREQKDPFVWLSREEGMLGNRGGEEIRESDIFSESRNIVLLLRSHNDTDNKKDLFFLHFRGNLSNFGVSRADQVLSTENKTIIGFLLQRFLENARRQSLADHHISEIFNDQVLNLVTHNHQQKKEFDRLQRKYSALLLDHAVKRLNNLGEEYGTTFILTDDAKARIREFKGEQDIMVKVLEEAVTFSYNIYQKEKTNQIRIDDWALNFDKFRSIGSAEERLPEIDPREAKALDLLDKLELSSEKVLEHNLPLTSANVGHHCPTAISAPAITDALKKHRKRVVLVLHKYPERWPVIRNRFRPLKNLLQEVRYNDNIAV